jgi:hypothetical protein
MWMSKSGPESGPAAWLIPFLPGGAADAAVVGLTGLEPVTPRLSSVCSNQLSYRPRLVAGSRGSPRGDPAAKIGGGMGIRTPDIQLAKLALYQLSYTPFRQEDFLYGMRKTKD